MQRNWNKKNTDMETKYDFKQIPPGWKFCFNNNCPMKEECLRYQTATELPEDRVWGSAVFPTALKEGRCKFFRKDEKVTLATGFVVENNPRMNQIFLAMRRQMTHYLGGNGTYYLYRNGRKFLSPQQMEWIKELFKRYGYCETGSFDRHEVTLHY